LYLYSGIVNEIPLCYNKLVMKIADVKKKFKNEWVLAEVLKENRLNQPVEIKPIMSGSDPDKLYEHMAKLPQGKTFATFYTGKMTGTYLFSCKK